MNRNCMQSVNSTGKIWKITPEIKEEIHHFEQRQREAQRYLDSKHDKKQRIQDALILSLFVLMGIAFLTFTGITFYKLNQKFEARIETIK